VYSSGMYFAFAKEDCSSVWRRIEGTPEPWEKSCFSSEANLNGSLWLLKHSRDYRTASEEEQLKLEETLRLEISAGLPLQDKAYPQFKDAHLFSALAHFKLKCDL
jgi:hypothetical protein